jgi:hypothetical protein
LRGFDADQVQALVADGCFAAWQGAHCPGGAMLGWAGLRRRARSAVARGQRWRAPCASIATSFHSSQRAMRDA